MIEILINLTIVVVVVSGGVWVYRSEKRNWNNGICPQTGKYWISFDMDSQGGRGYSSGDYTTWVSWPNIDKHYNDFAAKQLNGI